MSDFPTKDMYTRNLYISEFRTKNCIRELIYEKSIKENWWYATRAMSAFVLVVAEEIGAKYIVPTDIAMVYGILNGEI